MSVNKRTTRDQTRLLVDYMSSHIHLAMGEFYGPLGAINMQKEWEKLKEFLKNFGPDRSVDQWRQTWRDLKKNARYENSANREGLQATGNKHHCPIVSDISKKILDIIGQSSSLGIGPAESRIGPVNVELPVDLSQQTLPLPPHQQAAARPLPSPTLSMLQSLGHDYVSETEEPTLPVETNTTQRRRQRRQASRPYDVFSHLQEESNVLLQNITTLLEEHNSLLRDQNKILAEANNIASRK